MPNVRNFLITENKNSIMSIENGNPLFLVLLNEIIAKSDESSMEFSIKNEKDKFIEEYIGTDIINLQNQDFKQFIGNASEFLFIKMDLVCFLVKKKIGTPFWKKEAGQESIFTRLLL